MSPKVERRPWSVVRSAAHCAGVHAVLELHGYLGAPYELDPEVEHVRPAVERVEDDEQRH